VHLCKIYISPVLLYGLELMFITKPIPWNPWTTLVDPFTALSSILFCLTSNHILEHIKFTTMITRFNFPCIYFDNLSVWWCRLWKWGEMALLCGVFVPMVDLVAEISQTALSNTVYNHENMVQVM
jgi:hypothetical protein